MMKHSKLSDHTFKKGKFITPINSLPMMQEFEDEKSWTYGRMPEYIWIGLILKYYGREEGLRKSYSIISTLHKLAPCTANYLSYNKPSTGFCRELLLSGTEY